MTTTTPFMRDVVQLLYSPQFSSTAERLAPGDGEDLIQTVALKASKYDAAGGEVPRVVGAWLTTLLKNEASNLRASRSAQRRRPVRDPAFAFESPGVFPIVQRRGTSRDADGYVGVESVEESTVAAIDQDRRRHALRSAVEALAKERREAIVSFYWGEIPVAEHHGVPRGTVMSRLYRGREDLRVALGESFCSHF